MTSQMQCRPKLQFWLNTCPIWNCLQNGAQLLCLTSLCLQFELCWLVWVWCVFACLHKMVQPLLRVSPHIYSPFCPLSFMCWALRTTLTSKPCAHGHLACTNILLIFWFTLFCTLSFPKHPCPHLFRSPGTHRGPSSPPEAVVPPNYIAVPRY